MVSQANKSKAPEDEFNFNKRLFRILRCNQDSKAPNIERTILIIQRHEHLLHTSYRWKKLKRGPGQTSFDLALHRLGKALHTYDRFFSAKRVFTCKNIFCLKFSPELPPPLYGKSATLTPAKYHLQGLKILFLFRIFTPFLFIFTFTDLSISNKCSNILLLS